MTWTIGGVSLPIDPQTVQIKNPANVKAIDFPGQLPILLLFGKKARVLVIEGYLTESGKTKEQLYNDYISNLEGLLNTEVSIDASDSRYDGNWAFVKFDYKEAKGDVHTYTYRMEFWQGYAYV